jgi:hypothetical protein
LVDEGHGCVWDSKRRAGFVICGLVLAWAIYFDHLPARCLGPLIPCPLPPIHFGDEPAEQGAKLAIASIPVVIAVLAALFM